MTADEFIADPVLGRSPKSIDQVIAKWESNSVGQEMMQLVWPRCLQFWVLMLQSVTAS